jgi:hypothetical protein
MTPPLVGVLILIGLGRMFRRPRPVPVASVAAVAMKVVNAGRIKHIKPTPAKQLPVQPDRPQPSSPAHDNLIADTCVLLSSGQMTEAQAHAAVTTAVRLVKHK